MVARLSMGAALSLLAGVAFAQGAGAVQVGGAGNSAPGVLSTEVGGFNNTALGDGSAVIGGGQNSAFTFGSVTGGQLNATNTYGHVGGGLSNGAGPYAAVGGGLSNQAQDAGVVGGGNSNFAGAYGAITGGAGNNASGIGSFVGGGGFNRASALGASVVGGANNTASGNFSAVLAGSGATASAAGAVVIADSSSTATNSTANSLLLSFAGGVTVTSATAISGNLSVGSAANGGINVTGNSISPAKAVELTQTAAPAAGQPVTGVVGDFVLTIPQPTNVVFLRSTTADVNVNRIVFTGVGTNGMPPAGTQLLVAVNQLSNAGSDFLFQDSAGTAAFGELMLNGTAANFTDFERGSVVQFVSDGSDWYQSAPQSNNNPN